MTSGRALIQKTRAALEQAGLYNQNEMNVLFETALGVRPAMLLPGGMYNDADAARLDALVARRCGGEPLQYIAGSWPFLDFELAVGPGVLIPRPETEQLATRAIELARTPDTPTVLDLCSGSGCVAIAIKRALPHAAVSSVELSDDALAFLRRNADALCAGDIAVSAGDVFLFQDTLADASLDLITANPPYVVPADYAANKNELAHEPEMAFLGGADGLDFYRHIAPAYLPKLKPGGALVFETGFDQTDAVAQLMRDAGYTAVEVLCDPFGLPRNALGFRP